MKKIFKYEIIDHGVDHAQYFQEYGTAYTKYDDCMTGVGYNAKEAYEDAVDLIASCGHDVSSLPKRPKGIRVRDKVPAAALKHEDNEMYYYVSIRYSCK